MIVYPAWPTSCFNCFRLAIADFSGYWSEGHRAPGLVGRLRQAVLQCDAGQPPCLIMTSRDTKTHKGKETEVQKHIYCVLILSLSMHLPEFNLKTERSRLHYIILQGHHL